MSTDATPDNTSTLLPHPLTGKLFPSPVPPDSGWPNDPATTTTPVAKNASQVSELAASATTCADLNAMVSVCRACPRLVAWREEVAREKRAAYSDQPYWGRPVPSFGNPASRRIIVGLAPGAHGANRTGRMFTGDKAGDWIFAALYRNGLATAQTAVAAGDGMQLPGARMVAPVRCVPPENKPTTTELHTCNHWFTRECDLIQPVAILALGGIAWTTILRSARAMGWKVPRPQPKFGHGAQAKLAAPYGSVTLLGCYHPSQHNTQTGRLTAQMLNTVVHTFAQIGSETE